MEFDVVAKTNGGDRKVSQQWSQLLTVPSCDPTSDSPMEFDVVAKTNGGDPQS